MTEHDLPIATHEPHDVSARALAYGLSALLLSLLLIGGALFWIFPGVLADHRVALPLPAYPEPQLQADPAADMQQFRVRELAQLNAWFWRDRAAGTVHLPIDDAMRAVAEQGIADWPQQKPGQP